MMLPLKGRARCLSLQEGQGGASFVVHEWHWCGGVDRIGVGVLGEERGCLEIARLVESG